MSSTVCVQQFSVIETGHMPRSVSLVVTLLGVASCTGSCFANVAQSGGLDPIDEEIPMFGMVPGLAGRDLSSVRSRLRPLTWPADYPWSANSGYPGQSMLTRATVVLFCLVPAAIGAEPPAKNVILLIGDAMGVPTLSAASIQAHDEPHALFIQQFSNVAAVDTSTASEWVTDSAASMTAMVTGEKTHNGVISQGPDAVRGREDGAPLKTILEYAEEHGLATGVLTNSPVVDATPAACYAHANDRNRATQIFSQVWQPRFGDGIDLIIGPGRATILERNEEFAAEVQANVGPRLVDSVNALRPDSQRPIVLLDSPEFDLVDAARRSVEILSQDPDGFFLMVESDSHTYGLLQGLERVIMLDNVARMLRALPGAEETLLIVVADHSYDFRVISGLRDEPLMPEVTDPEYGDGASLIALLNVHRENTHTGEDVLAMAEGPGAEQVHGFLANTDLFRIMMAAYGWQATP